MTRHYRFALFLSLSLVPSPRISFLFYFLSINSRPREEISRASLRRSVDLAKSEILPSQHGKPRLIVPFVGEFAVAAARDCFGGTSRKEARGNGGNATRRDRNMLIAGNKTAAASLSRANGARYNMRHHAIRRARNNPDKTSREIS